MAAASSSKPKKVVKYYIKDYALGPICLGDNIVLCAKPGYVVFGQSSVDSKKESFFVRDKSISSPTFVLWTLYKVCFNNFLSNKSLKFLISVYD